MGQRVRSFDLSPWVDRGVFAQASRSVKRAQGRAPASGGPSTQGLAPWGPASKTHPSGRPACPPGIDGFIYTVLPGDSFKSVADAFGLTPEQLAAANPDVEDTAAVFPGRHLCIPKVRGVAFPCSALLLPTRAEPVGVEAVGAAVIRPIREDRFQVLFSAAGLPELETAGSFQAYAGVLQAGDEATSALLAKSEPPGQPAAWCGTLGVAAPPPEDTELLIVPVNLETGVQGAPVMRGFVSTCGG